VQNVHRLLKHHRALITVTALFGASLEKVVVENWTDTWRIIYIFSVFGCGILEQATGIGLSVPLGNFSPACSMAKWRSFFEGEVPYVA